MVHVSVSLRTITDSIFLRWFMGLNLDEEVWDVTVFTKNGDRLLEARQAFLAEVVEQVPEKGSTSDEHFTVGGNIAGNLGGREEFPAEGWNERTNPLRKQN